MSKTAVDLSNYEIVVEPCADRESRIFYRRERYRPDPVGCDYRSHAYALMRPKSGGSFVIRVDHGGGREVIAVPQFFGEEADWLTTIPDERRQYAALACLYQMARDTERAAIAETASQYAQAFAEGRLKKRRKAGRVRVEIEPRAAAAVDAA